MRIVDSHAVAWSVVTDVHGAPGSSGWRQLVPGRTLAGPWEAVEMARLAAGGISGLHRHTRTNEIYVIVSGRAHFTLDGRTFSMCPGHVAVTGTGSTHGIANAGPDELVWLVIEVPAPPASRERARQLPTEVTMHRRNGPIDLSGYGALDLLPYGVEPLLEAGLDEVAAGVVRPLHARDSELFMYLLSGSATVVTPNGDERAVEADTGITLTLGESANLTAVAAVRLFWVRSDAAELAS